MKIRYITQYNDIHSPKGWDGTEAPWVFNKLIIKGTKFEISHINAKHWSLWGSFESWETTKAITNFKLELIYDT